MPNPLSYFDNPTTSIFQEELRLKLLFEEILNPDYFGPEAWSFQVSKNGSSEIVLDFAWTKSGKIEDPVKLNIREKNVKSLIDAMSSTMTNRTLDDKKREASLYLHLDNKSRQTKIIFGGLNTKNKLEAKVKDLFPHWVTTRNQRVWEDQSISIFQADNDIELIRAEPAVFSVRSYTSDPGFIARRRQAVELLDYLLNENVVPNRYWRENNGSLILDIADLLFNPSKNKRSYCIKTLKDLKDALHEKSHPFSVLIFQNETQMRFEDVENKNKLIDIVNDYAPIADVKSIENKDAITEILQLIKNLDPRKLDLMRSTRECQISGDSELVRKIFKGDFIKNPQTVFDILWNVFRINLYIHYDSISTTLQLPLLAISHYDLFQAQLDSALSALSKCKVTDSASASSTDDINPTTVNPVSQPQPSHTQAMTVSQYLEEQKLQQKFNFFGQDPEYTTNVKNLSVNRKI